MFIVILFMFLGISIGYVIRTRITSHRQYDTVSTWTGRAITGFIWLLLFMLGIEVGSSERIISALPTLGIEAIILSVCGILGSCVLAWGLWKSVQKGGKE